MWWIIIIKVKHDSDPMKQTQPCVRPYGCPCFTILPDPVVAVNERALSPVRIGRTSSLG